MIEIEYGPYGKIVSDFELDEWQEEVIQKAKNNKKHYVKVSNEIMIDAARILVNKKLIEPHEIIFRYYDTIITVNEYGRLDLWPDGFCNTRDRIIEKLLTISCTKRKNK